MSTKKEVIQQITAGLAAHLAGSVSHEFSPNTFQEILGAFDWSGLGCLGKASMDEPVFILRAHDPLFTETVQRWAIAAKRDGLHPEKAQEAVQLAHEGEKWRESEVAREEIEERERRCTEQGSDI